MTAIERIMFGVMGERLIKKLRVQLLTAILHKQISWFDREDRAPGILTSVMSEDVAALNGMTAEVVVTIVEVIFGMFAGITLAIIVCW